MATEYRKILLRRGLREELTADLLEPGELGYTRDTNQVFIGTERAINEIQFDPFVNAHATIQSWLDSDDCPIPGLTVDEDLVIRNIPDYHEGITGKSGVDTILDALFFYVQVITLDGEFPVNDNDTLYQRRYITSKTDSFTTNLQKGAKYIITELNGADWNVIAGTTGETYAFGDIILVEEDEPDTLAILDTPIGEDVPHNSITKAIENEAGEKSIQVVEINPDDIVAEKEYRLTIRNVADADGNNIQIMGSSSDGTLDSLVESMKLHANFDPAVLELSKLDKPNVDNTGFDEYAIQIKFLTSVHIPGVLLKIVDVDEYTYGKVLKAYEYDPVTDTTKIEVNVRELSYAFLAETAPNDSGYGDYDIHKSKFGMFEWDGTEWVSQDLEHVKHDPANSTKPDYTAVLDGNKIKYYKKFAWGWEHMTIGNTITVDGIATMDSNTVTHVVPQVTLDAYNYETAGTWTVTYVENKDTDEEVIHNLVHGTDYELWFDPTATNTDPGKITIIKDIDGDSNEDEITVEYEYPINDFQFSKSPPETFTNTNTNPPETFDALNARSDNTALQVGDVYVYTDRDFDGHLYAILSEYNVFHAKYDDFHMPVYDDDADATENAPMNVRHYVKPSTENATLSIRTRDRSDGDYWFDYFYGYSKSLFYFSTDPVKSVMEEDTANAIEVSGTNEFPAANHGRPRQNVEVLTENSMLHMFADQHLSALYSYTGKRSNLFRKTLSGTSGVFLKYHKNVCTTFFIDYSLLQEGSTDKFMRIGQLKVMNTAPLKPTDPKTKLTDENTETWYDGEVDGIAESTEFSNIEFYSEFEGDHLVIKYTQKEDWETEISYTVKRWTM